MVTDVRQAWTRRHNFIGPDGEFEYKTTPGGSAGEEFSDRMTLGLACTFLDAGEALVNQTSGPVSGTVAGEFSSNYIHIIGPSFAARF